MIEDGDIFGDGVNIAARLEGSGRAGRHLRSAGCASMPERVALAFEDIGEQQVKNIAEPVRVFRVPASAAAPASCSAAAALPDKPSVAVLPSPT